MSEHATILESNRARAVVVAALVAAVAYVALPASFGAEMLRVGASLAAAVIALLAWRRSADDRAALWLGLALFAVVSSVATLWTAIQVFGDGRSFPSFVDILHVVGAICLVVGVVASTRSQRRDTDALGSFEVGTLAIAIMVGVWLLVAEPVFSDGDVVVRQLVAAVSAPLVTSVAVAAAFRAIGQRGLSVPLVTLAVGTVFVLIDQTARGVMLLDGRLGPEGLGGVAQAVGLVAPLMLVAPALFPAQVIGWGEPAAPVVSVGRTIGLSVAVLAPLTVLLALMIADLGSSTTRFVIAAAAVVSVGLALARMWGLLDAVRRLTERRGQDRLAAMVEHSSDVVVLMNEQGRMSYASPGLSGTLGHRTTDWVGRAMIDLVAEEARLEATGHVADVLAAGADATVKFETTLVRVDGQRRRMEATIANLLGGDAVDGIVATFRDVTEQRNLERQLSHRAFHDELTGLANRALFLDRMDHALRMARSDDDPVVVLFVDLDDFKSVNDALGHGVGDQLLRTISDRIRVVAGPGDTPARLGGDEFALLLEDQGGVERALDVAESLLSAMSQPAKLSGYDLSVLASVGVAVAAPGMTTSSLLRDADIAMYEAKRAGKGQIKIFDPAMRLGATTQLEFRHELAVALEQQQFRLVYQPLVSLHTGEVVGAEALLRWAHPDRGEVSPGEFIPVAERAGLIVPIGEWVLHEAMTEAQRWQHRGRRGGQRRISINVSGSQMRSGQLVNQVRDALRESGLDPRVVTLEVTETVLVEQVEDAVEVLEELRSLGVQIAIDDFGTGYCSLSYLQKFPVDVLKIDRQFVNEVDGDHRQSSLARMILQMSAALGVASVGEGIERPTQLQALRQLGCDVGQGYLLSRPLEADVTRERFGVAEPTGHLVAGPPQGDPVSLASP